MSEKSALMGVKVLGMVQKCCCLVKKSLTRIKAS